MITKKIPWPLLFGGGVKLASAVFALLNTRLIVELAGVKEFGSVQTILSLMPWFMLINLGVPNSIQNIISSKKDKTTESETKGAVLRINLIGIPISLIIGVIAASFFSTILPNLDALFSKSEMAIIFVAFSINSISQIIIQYEYGVRKVSYSLLSPVLVQCMMAVVLFFARGDVNEVVTLGIVLPLLVNYLLLLSLSGILKNAIFKKSFLKKIIHDSKSFALLTAMGQVTLACDYIIMSNVVHEEDIGVYGIVNRIFSFVITLYGASLGLLWTELSKSYSEGDTKSYISEVVRNLIFGFIGVFIVLSAMLMWKPIVFTALIGDSVMPDIPNSLIVAGSLYCLIRIWADTFAVAEMIKGSANAINAYIPYQLVISVAMQYLMINWYGVIGAYIGMSISFVMTACWILPRKVLKA